LAAGVELRQLRYFVTPAEELNFGRAAEPEHIVQSSLSQQVQRLERALGVRLLERSTRHVSLTAAGAVFLVEGCRPASARVRALEPGDCGSGVRQGRLRQEAVKDAPAIGTDGELPAGAEQAIFKHYCLAYEPGAGGERRLARR
jgi:Bacterial regulatory helix-turn-helix protein, lysR family